MERGGRHRERVIELSAPLNDAPGDISQGMVVASTSGEPPRSGIPRGSREVTPIPSLGKQAANLAGAMGRVVVAAATGQSVAVGDEERDRRLDICRACPEYDAANDRCRKCGCVGKWKAKLATEHCPLDPPKW
jgi:hypothetical protein